MSATLDLPGLDVSRETLDRLGSFVALATRWTARINLVAPSTVPDLWQRHVADSAQLLPLAPPHATTWADLGAGGGFPGIVVAILAGHDGPRMTLIESDARKCAFLRTAARELSLDVAILEARVEATAPLGADVVTARALAPLDRLLPLVARHLAPGGTALLQKGRDWSREVDAARAAGWTFGLDARASVTDPEARILIVTEPRHG